MTNSKALKMNPALERDERRKKSRNADVRRLLQDRSDKRFDWGSRYDHKYVLSFARDYDFKACRLQKAIDALVILDKKAK